MSLQNNQADLENATEVLSGYLERDISQDSLQDIKQKVQDKYRFVSEKSSYLKAALAPVMPSPVVGSSMYLPSYCFLQSHVPGKLFAVGPLPYIVIISLSLGISEQQCPVPEPEIAGSEALVQGASQLLAACFCAPAGTSPQERWLLALPCICSAEQ